MAGFIQNILWNSVEGFVEAGTRSAGEFAGNALIKAGDMIENGGRGVGNSIEKKATNYGSNISGQTYKPSPKALPSTARKPVIKRSNSLPASSKLPTTKPKASNSTPLGAKKYPGTTQINGHTAKKAVVGGVGRAKSTAGGVMTGANKAIGGVTGGVGGAGGVVGGGPKALTGATSSFKGGAASRSTPSRNIPKPYPSVNALPKPNGVPASSGPKTAVKPGAPRPFVPPVEQKKATDSKPKPYPGTNTLPGQASKTPVTQQKLKPLPRLGPQVGAGQKMQHISV